MFNMFSSSVRSYALLPRRGLNSSWIEQNKFHPADIAEAKAFENVSDNSTV
jgi:hypothetical protein